MCNLCVTCSLSCLFVYLFIVFFYLGYIHLRRFLSFLIFFIYVRLWPASSSPWLWRIRNRKNQMQFISIIAVFNCRFSSLFFFLELLHIVILERLLSILLVLLLIQLIRVLNVSV